MRTYMTKPQLVKDIKSSLPGLFIPSKFDLIFKIRVWNLLLNYYKDRGLIPRNAQWTYPKPKSTKHEQSIIATPIHNGFITRTLVLVDKETGEEIK